MSVMRCYYCDRNIDTDFYEWDDVIDGCADCAMDMAIEEYERIEKENKNDE